MRKWRSAPTNAHACIHTHTCTHTRASVRAQAPTLTHSLTRSFTHSLTHSLAHITSHHITRPSQRRACVTSVSPWNNDLSIGSVAERGTLDVALVVAVGATSSLLPALALAPSSGWSRVVVVVVDSPSSTTGSVSSNSSASWTFVVHACVVEATRVSGC